MISPLNDKGVIHRYRQYLPVTDKTPVISLSEGSTPLIHSTRLSEKTGSDVYIKFEGLNPTGSFKDRGMTMAISKAVEQGARTVICASTGNTSAAAAAYAELVAAAPVGSLWDKALQQQIFLGDDAFIARMQALAAAPLLGSPQIPLPQRSMPLTLAEWLERCETREEALMMAHRKSGLSMSAMATEIGLSATRVGQLIRRAEAAKRSRSIVFFRTIWRRISLTGGTTYMPFPAFGLVCQPCWRRGACDAGGRSVAADTACQQPCILYSNEYTSPCL